MGWQSVVALNVLIAVCYLAISGIIVHGLVRTRQLTQNRLAVATAAIFVTCALHHAEHAAHLALGPHGETHDLSAARALFGDGHAVIIDLLGAMAAVWYLASRRSYKALLNTPAMFEDAVRVELERRLRQLAYTDQLTDVPNRSAYHHLAQGLRDSDDLTGVVYLDLEGFKQVNDRLGHDAGDRVLVEVARRCQQALGPTEQLFRLGGDEFVVVIPGADRFDEDALRARFRRMLAEPVALREGQARIDVSVGVATGPASQLDVLLREADVAMYRDKRARRRIRPPIPRPAAAPEQSVASERRRQA